MKKISHLEDFFFKFCGLIRKSSVYSNDILDFRDLSWFLGIFSLSNCRIKTHDLMINNLSFSFVTFHAVEKKVAFMNSKKSSKLLWVQLVLTSGTDIVLTNFYAKSLWNTNFKSKSMDSTWIICLRFRFSEKVRKMQL